ncbi:MAG: YegS/Rv2252/BmrU family lipid kinase [Bacteroidales bacterium]|nr:YegS/Rv2252/BmrU family lipid kinase [Bacteroidales bacterium]
MSNNSGKIIFILNPISGFFGFRRRQVRRIIGRYIKKERLDGEIWYSKYAGHTTELVRKAVENQAQTVVVAGGDGSINEAARSLIHTDTALGIIPCGSGNGLANYLKIPFSITKALQVIKENHIKAADTIKIDNQYAFSLAGIGLDAMIAKRYRAAKQRGFFSYVHSSLVEYVNYTPETITIKTDTMEIQEKCICLVCANSNQFGYNFRIAPQADLFDGYMEVVIVKKMPLISAPLSSMQIWTGYADKCLYISSFKAKKVSIIREQEGMMNVDGDPSKSGQIIEAEVLPASLKLIVPKTIV